MSIAIWKFWTEYTPAPTNENPLAMRSIDWVEYGPVGSRDRSTTCSPVAKLINVQEMSDRGNIAIVLANDRSTVIRKAYDAWKAGQEIPIDGTPLAAWNGITPEQADVMRLNNVRTVEEVASLTDAHKQRISIPHLTDLIKQAQRFLASADTVRYAQELAQRDKALADQSTQISDLAEQNRALMEKVNQLAEMVAGKTDTDDGEKRGPGRPRKVAA